MIRLGIIHIDEIVSYGGGQVFTDDHGQSWTDRERHTEEDGQAGGRAWLKKSR